MIERGEQDHTKKEDKHVKISKGISLTF